ncbi:SRPBCC domain-containing protein [Zavarzinia sp. CC-PAN008]|uniref:SRPBCC domain-containing protein n=1 Tax=Zavarzinia sp. CC-PAN008 TaxID=3243332 RepID=UPI003F749C57
MSARVQVSIRVAATPQRAFDVFTREIGQWWRTGGLFRFTPREPGRLAFEGGAGGRLVEHLANGKVFEIGRVTSWHPGALLAFTWRQATFQEGQETHVRVSFEPVADGTRVTVDHQGWETVPQAHVARHGMPEAVFMQRLAQDWLGQMHGLRTQVA